MSPMTSPNTFLSARLPQYRHVSSLPVKATEHPNRVTGDWFCLFHRVNVSSDKTVDRELSG